MQSRRRTTRRRFLQGTAGIGIGYWIAGRPAATRADSPNEKLNVACIGVGGQGAHNVEQVRSANIVALCDVDEARAAGTFKKYEKAQKFADYRRMLDKLHKQIDGVVISTPDHTHAPATLAALQLGKHVYCEKPLTHTIGEARRVAQAAARAKVVTQMGNNGNALPGVRRAVELIRAQPVGPIREIHAWTDRPGKIWVQGIDRPTDTPPVPKTLHWDLWLGVATERPYHPCYLPGKWRGWYDFGTGPAGDMACHICNAAFWGMDLRDPVAVEADVSDTHKETFPAWSRIRWDFPARPGRPAIKFHWYDGGQMPPRELGNGEPLSDNGIILVGERGRIYLPKTSSAGAVLLPEKDFADFQGPPKTLPDSPGHHEEWIRNCKSGDLGLDYMSHFGRAAVMTEVFLLGAIAVRMGKRLEWDARNAKVTNVPEANAYVDPPYRKGWGA